MSADLGATVLDGVPHPVLVVGHDGTIRYANLACGEALGYEEPAELVGLPRHRTMHPTRVDGSAFPDDDCLVQQALLVGERAWGADEWFVRRDGSMFPLVWSSAPIDLPDGPGAVVAFTEVTELRAAQGRHAVDHERSMRQQIARDLHDGAQQRLVVVLVALQLAREELSRSPARAGELLDEAADHAQHAIDELRELAAGIHPAILSSHGLSAAVEALAGRCPLPVSVVSTLAGRLPEATEAHAFYVVADALADAAADPDSSHVAVTLGGDDTVLVIEVSVDGHRGARRVDDQARGRLVRRMLSGGAFTRTDAAGGGTVLRAELPIVRTPSSDLPAQPEG